ETLLPGLPRAHGLPAMALPELPTGLVVVVEIEVAAGNPGLPELGEAVLEQAAAEASTPVRWRDGQVVDRGAPPVVTGSAWTSAPGREVDLVSVQIRDRHVSLTPRFVLRIQEDRDAARPVLLVKDVDIVDLAADRRAVVLPIVLVQRDREFPATHSREERL